MKTIALTLSLIGTTLFADHLISDLEGEWYSSIFAKSVRYTFSGVMPLDSGRYIFRYTRPIGNGTSCIGSGIIQLSTGKARAVEVCPPNAEGIERVFLAVWTLTNEHHELHLTGGYYNEGKSAFHDENLDKESHEQ